MLIGSCSTQADSRFSCVVKNYTIPHPWFCLPVVECIATGAAHRKGPCLCCPLACKFPSPGSWCILSCTAAWEVSGLQHSASPLICEAGRRRMELLCICFRRASCIVAWSRQCKTCRASARCASSHHLLVTCGRRAWNDFVWCGFRQRYLSRSSSSAMVAQCFLQFAEVAQHLVLAFVPVRCRKRPGTASI